MKYKNLTGLKNGQNRKILDQKKARIAERPKACRICGRPSPTGTCKRCQRFLRTQDPFLKYQA